MKNVDHPFNTPAVLSLCTGGLRGLERGLEKAIGEINTVAYVEIEAFIIENLVRQMEQGVLASAPIWSNVKTFPTVAESFHGKVHIITGGYPCQPFSVAGNQGGEEDPRHLWPYIQRIVKAVDPVCCFFENVPGHINLGYDEVYRSLRALGYQVEAGVFSAEEVGAPHRRERLFILALKLADPEHNGMDGSKKRQGTGKRNADNKTGKKATKQSKGRNTVAVTNDINGGGKSQKQLRKKGARNKSNRGGENELANSNRVGHSHSNTSKQSTKRRVDALSDFATGCGKEVDNSDGKRHEQKHNVSTRGNTTELTSKGLADTTCIRVQRNWPDWKQKSITQIRKELFGCDRGTSRWPASPGEEQHEWEAPRLESSMGFTINGYNFREDLLRMAGNGVVDDTATIGFLTLLKKFI